VEAERRAPRQLPEKPLTRLGSSDNNGALIRRHQPRPAASLNFQELKAPMNKAELVSSVQKTLGKDTSKAAAEKAVTATIESMAAALRKGRNVQLIGFGTFKVVNRKARNGVNPKTGERIKIKASKSVKFAVGKDLKSKL
jgi:DNA-binding protein HU-beta